MLLFDDSHKLVVFRIHGSVYLLVGWIQQVVADVQKRILEVIPAFPRPDQHFKEPA